MLAQTVAPISLLQNVLPKAGTIVYTNFEYFFLVWDNKNWFLKNIALIPAFHSPFSWKLDEWPQIVLLKGVTLIYLASECPFALWDNRNWSRQARCVDLELPTKAWHNDLCPPWMTLSSLEQWKRSKLDEWTLDILQKVSTILYLDSECFSGFWNNEHGAAGTNWPRKFCQRLVQWFKLILNVPCVFGTMKREHTRRKNAECIIEG